MPSSAGAPCPAGRPCWPASPPSPAPQRAGRRGPPGAGADRAADRPAARPPPRTSPGRRPPRSRAPAPRSRPCVPPTPPAAARPRSRPQPGRRPPHRSGRPGTPRAPLRTPWCEGGAGDTPPRRQPRRAPARRWLPAAARQLGSSAQPLSLRVGGDATWTRRQPAESCPQIAKRACRPLGSRPELEHGREPQNLTAPQGCARARGCVARERPAADVAQGGRAARPPRGGGLDGLAGQRMRAVINATGVVLHTNLGRAPLSQAAVAAITQAAGYSTVEYDLAAGARGRRGAAAEALLREVTGAPAALVVNNAAGALLLALGGLARDCEVVVSRGQLIEIGGEFRLPAIMQAAGVDLVEVGTTNRTHLADYERAIGERTACLLAVHPSN